MSMGMSVPVSSSVGLTSMYVCMYMDVFIIVLKEELNRLESSADFYRK